MIYLFFLTNSLNAIFIFSGFTLFFFFFSSKRVFFIYTLYLVNFLLFLIIFFLQRRIYFFFWGCFNFFEGKLRFNFSRNFFFRHFFLVQRFPFATCLLFLIFLLWGGLIFSVFLFSLLNFHLFLRFIMFLGFLHQLLRTNGSKRIDRLFSITFFENQSL